MTQPVKGFRERMMAGSRHLFALSAVSLFVAAFMFLAVHDALAIRLTMKRVIFEGPKRAEILTIINNTAEEQVYRLGWRNIVMTEEDGLKYVENEADLPAALNQADEMIRFAPRRVVLAPGSSQQIRLMLRRPKDLADGEYRSHFWIKPEVEAVRFDPDRVESTGAPKVELKILTGLTLPVIVRAGKMDVSVRMTDMKAYIKDGNVAVDFTLHRDGNRSVYGDFQYYCDGQLVKETRGIAVYTEVDKRFMKLAFPRPAAGCSDVRITYTAVDDDPLYKGKIMAEGSARL